MRTLFIILLFVFMGSVSSLAEVKEIKKRNQPSFYTLPVGRDDSACKSKDTAGAYIVSSDKKGYIQCFNGKPDLGSHYFKNYFAKCKKGYVKTANFLVEVPLSHLSKVLFNDVCMNKKALGKKYYTSTSKEVPCEKGYRPGRIYGVVDLKNPKNASVLKAAHFPEREDVVFTKEKDFGVLFYGIKECIRR